MFKGEFKFDLNDVCDFGWPQYMWAYATTNEPIDKLQQLVPARDKRVLTVAASGDQPLMYAAAGAAHIDTFDITINACAIMDFKTTAKRLSVDAAKYKNLILSFSDLSEQDDQLHHIVNNMPDRTRSLMKHHTQNWPTCAFARENFTSVYEPNFDQTTRNRLNTPFNFIWADLINLHKYLDCTYDIIYLSNIFDHYYLDDRKTGDISKTIWRLWTHLNAGGKILCVSNQSDILKQLKSIKGRFKIFPRKTTSITFPPFDTNRYHWQPIIIQRTR